MGTVGRIAIRAPHSNYRLDPTKSIAERSMRFAVGGSVFNELWHTHAAIDNLYSFAARPSLTTVGFMMLNLSLVNLQRYNRARMVKRVNEEMANGDRLTGYTNWLGIDGGAARQIGDDG